MKWTSWQKNDKLDDKLLNVEKEQQDEDYLPNQISCEIDDKSNLHPSCEAVTSIFLSPFVAKTKIQHET